MDNYPSKDFDDIALTGAWLIFWIVVAVFLIVILCVCTGVSYRYYRKERRNRKQLQIMCSNCNCVQSSYAQTNYKKGSYPRCGDAKRCPKTETGLGTCAVEGKCPTISMDDLEDDLVFDGREKDRRLRRR